MLFAFAPLTPPWPRLPVWPPLDRAGLTPPALPAPKRRRAPARPLPPAVFRTVYVVGCGKSKLDRKASARDLYTGNLFQAARQHAETHGDSWRIVSARYGLLKPETTIKPYNQRLPRRGEDLDCWARNVAANLAQEYRHKLAVVCLAGREYAAPLAIALARHGIECTTPLDGLSVGRRLQWFKTNRTERPAPAPAATCPRCEQLVLACCCAEVN